MGQTYDIYLPTGPQRRRDLLPIWIKYFCWIFFLRSIGIVVQYLLYLFIDYPISESIFGIKGSEAFDWLSILVFCTIILNAVAAYMLWFEKDHAMIFAKTMASIGFFICVFRIFNLENFDSRLAPSIRIEIILLLIYMWRLHKISDQWKNMTH